MKIHFSTLSAVAVLTSLSLTATADAQLLWRWFGPKSADKNPAIKAHGDARRATEANIEIAWLADPATFPYYLEANTTPKQLEVRGYVPNKTVREQALKIAQMHSSLPVIDSMKEHASLTVRPAHLAPQQLQSSVQSSLKVALPKQHQQLKVDIGNEGMVFVSGQVTSLDEKLAVSHALRRLHGCTSVQNLTLLPGETARLPLEPREPAPIIKTSSQPPTKSDKPPASVQENKSRNWLWPFAKPAASAKNEDTKKPAPKDTPEPPLFDMQKPIRNEGPVLIPEQVDVKTPMPTPKEVVKIPAPPAPAPKLSAAELQKRIRTALPSAKNVNVELTSPTEVRIVIEIASEKDLSPAAERVFALPELEHYRPDLQFKISAP